MVIVITNKTVGYEAGYDIPLPYVTYIVTRGIACYHSINQSQGYKVTGVFMSVKDLIEKVNKSQIGNHSTQTIQEVVKEVSSENQPTEIFDTVDLSKLSAKELLALNKQLTSWLETHECQTGTDNKLDINDRPYNHELYIKKLHLYEETYVAYFSRPLREELEGVL